MRKLIAVAVLLVAAMSIISAAHREDERARKNREQPAWCHDEVDISKSGLCKNIGREYEA